HGRVGKAAGENAKPFGKAARTCSHKIGRRVALAPRSFCCRGFRVGASDTLLYRLPPGRSLAATSRTAHKQTPGCAGWPGSQTRIPGRKSGLSATHSRRGEARRTADRCWADSAVFWLVIPRRWLF